MPLQQKRTRQQQSRSSVREKQEQEDEQPPPQQNRARQQQARNSLMAKLAETGVQPQWKKARAGQIALQSCCVCDNFSQQVLEESNFVEIPRPFVGLESNFAFHWFLESNFFAKAQFQYEEQIRLPCCHDVIILPSEEEELQNLHTATMSEAQGGFQFANFNEADVIAQLNVFLTNFNEADVQGLTNAQLNVFSTYLQTKMSELMNPDISHDMRDQAQANILQRIRTAQSSILACCQFGPIRNAEKNCGHPPGQAMVPGGPGGVATK